MSNKFEKLLDYLVNEEMEKANELFHEIIVEKSREIYSDLIAEEVEEDLEEETDDEDNQKEADDDQQDEGFMHDEDESMYEIGGDPADKFTSDVEDPTAMDDESDMDMDDESGMGMDDEFGGDDDGDHATKSDIMDIKDDIAELKAEFEALLAHEKGEDEDDDMDFDADTEFGSDDEDEADDAEDDESDDEEADDEDEETDESFMREYREVIGKPYGGGKVAGTKEDAGTNTRPVVSSAKGRPESKANAGNLNQSGGKEGQKVGLAGTPKGEYTKGVEGNINGKGAPKLAKVPAGHGAEKKGHGETSVNDRPILKKQ